MSIPPIAEKTALQFNLEGHQPYGRPVKWWTDNITEDMWSVGLSAEDTSEAKLEKTSKAAWNHHGWWDRYWKSIFYSLIILSLTKESPVLLQNRNHTIHLLFTHFFLTSFFTTLSPISNVHYFLHIHFTFLK